MRQLSTALQTLLETEGPLEYFGLIRLQLNTEFFITSMPYDLVYDGNLYTSDGGLISTDPPQITTTVDREIYKIKLTDHDGEMQSQFDLGIIGAEVEVFLGLIDPATSKPLLTTGDVYLVYKGTVDSHMVDATEGLSGREITISCASPMADLDSVNPFITSGDGMDQFSSIDTSFDDIFEKGAEIEIKWGKS